MIRALQKKFVFSAMLAITVLLVGLLGSINVINAMMNARQMDVLLEVLVNSESSHAPQKKPPKREKDEHGLFQAPMNENTRMSAVYFITRVDVEGELIYTDVSRIATVTEENAGLMTQAAIASGKTEGRMSGFRYRATPTADGQGTAWIFLNIAEQMHAALRLLAVSSMIGAACWLLMFLFVLLLSGRVIRPVAVGIERQKQFITDAGHEIKTPLAIILANTEAMELHGGESKWSRNIREQVTRLSGLMQNLLALAKIDETNIHSIKDTVALSPLAEGEAAMFREAMELKALQFECRIQPELTLSANKELIGRLISILLDNAVKYSPREGRIVFEMFRNEKGIQLIVANDCEKLPDCPSEKLFDRFYRGDSARTQKNGGYGIGLSAAQSIVEAHGGDITAAYRGESTIVFFVTL